MHDDLCEKAKAVLAANDRGGWTVPAGDLYPHQWLWDSCFIAIGLRHLDVDRSKSEIKSLMRGQWNNGMMPHMTFSGERMPRSDRVLWGSAINPHAPTGVATSGITQPPMLAEAVIAIGQKLKMPERRSWYKDMLPGIIKFHEWLYLDRDPNKEGLVTLIHPYESGLDNSPPWIEELRFSGIPMWVRLFKALKLDFILDLVRRDVRHSTLNQRMDNVEALSFWSALRKLRNQGYSSKKALAKPKLALQDLTFNCMLIRANACLQEISKVAGVQLPTNLQKNIKSSEQALETLWHEPTSQYYSRSFSRGELIMEPTVASLLPLYAGTIDNDRAKKLVDLLNKRSSYKAIWPVPSVPANSSYFNPIKYWQGPTWINMNWMIIKGLERYGFTKEADQLRQRSLDLVQKSGFAEYFNPQTGEPLGAMSFSWTASLTIDLIKH